MMFMNRYDIDEAYDRFARRDPASVLGRASALLLTFSREVDRVSDGWSYWRPPVNSAKKLMTLVYGHLRAGMGAYPHLPPATEAELKAALAPIKSFMTRKGKAAGMRSLDEMMPAPALDFTS